MADAGDLKSPADKQALAAKEQLTVAEKKFLSTFLSTSLEPRSKRIRILWDDWVPEVIKAQQTIFTVAGSYISDHFSAPFQYSPPLATNTWPDADTAMLPGRNLLGSERSTVQPGPALSCQQVT